MGNVRLIAEFCQNHNGKRTVLKSLIESAARSGFTHGKIQGLYSSELTKRVDFEDPRSPIYRPYDREFERLRYLDLSIEDEKWFVGESLKFGIVPMITVFTHYGVERAKEAGFNSIKIASYDCSSLPLIKSAASFAKELIVSTGATAWLQVRETAELLMNLSQNGISVALLHARTIYPAKASDTGLARMIALRDFKIPIGFSDHSRPDTDELWATKFAIFFGAEIVERHYTVLEKSETKDGPVSIDEVQAREICRFANLSNSGRAQELISRMHLAGNYLNISDLNPSEIERTNSKYYRGRVASKINDKEIFGWEEALNA